MASITTRWAAVVVSLAASAATGRADDPKAGAPPENKLIGTWKLVAVKYDGKERKVSDRDTRIKHITPTQFVWLNYDKDGKVDMALGGPYTLTGEKYEETPEYGVGSVLTAYKGKVQSFTWKVEGDKWYHTGKLSSGLTIDEVWERVEKK